MSEPLQVLLVEDDPLIARSLCLSLPYEGFALTLASDCEQAQRRLAERRLLQHPFDLVLLDVGLPDGSGIELCRLLRARDEALPILLVSARTDEKTAVAGIEGGADDYIRKPFGLSELVARMKRLTVRRQARALVEFGALCMDAGQRQAHIGDTALKLGPKEFEALLVLARAGGEVVTRERILASFGESGESVDRTIDSHLSHLRRKLKEAGADLRIAAVYGLGYRLELPAQKP